VFCGETSGRATVEHVIPRWARRTFDINGPLTLYAGDEPGAAARRRVDDLQHLNITLRGAICGDCNNGHLSRLEKAAQPLLQPMMLSAQAPTLDPAGQAVLATWAVKTVLLFELPVRQKYPTSRPIDGYAASAQEVAWLRAKGDPPRGRSSGWVGGTASRPRRSCTSPREPRCPRRTGIASWAT
jgi:hypothetical protein